MLWSVVICTRNRSRDLRLCLEAVAKVAPPGAGFEVIVVDNASTDQTAEVVAEAADANPMLVYLREERLGLSHARNRGVAEAKGELIAFLDDDARPEHDWLAQLTEAFRDPRTGCVGGRVLPSWRNEAGWPAWLPERLIGFFTVVDYGTARWLHYPDYPAGTNIAIRRSALLEAGGFSERLGRTGESLLSMEEVDLCLKLEQAGLGIWYQPGAVVRHTVHEDRVNREWVKERSRWQGISAAIIEHESMTRRYLAAKVLKYIVFTAVGSAGRCLFSVAGLERTALSCLCQTILCRGYLGKLWALTWGANRG